LQGLIFSLVVSGFIAFGQPFIRLYAGEGYEDAYWVAILMMIPNMIPLVQSICLSVLVAQNKHKFRALVYLGIAVANVIGTWYLMQIWGIIGAAFMTGLALVLGQGIIMNWYYHKKTGLDMIRFWKEVGGIYVVPVLLCVAAILLGRVIDYNTVWIMLVSIVVYSVIFLVLNWFFVLNGEEKDFVRNFIRLKKAK
jgi:O-antigen/teichoic acid export membrane protein